MEAVRITTPDGHVLAGDLVVPSDPRGAVVVCHPHPHHGGTRFDHLVTRIFEEVARHGFAALRFDFRDAHGGGVDERLDASAALDLVARRLPGVALHLAGYSFGAMVALGVHDGRLASHVLIAPPLGVGYREDPPAEGPLLVVVAEHDQFCPPPAVEAAVAAWPHAVARAVTVRRVAMADHFFAGRTDAVADEVVAWLDEPSA